MWKYLMLKIVCTNDSAYTFTYLYATMERQSVKYISANFYDSATIQTPIITFCLYLHQTQSHLNTNYVPAPQLTSRHIHGRCLQRVNMDLTSWYPFLFAECDRLLRDKHPMQKLVNGTIYFYLYLPLKWWKIPYDIVKHFE